MADVAAISRVEDRAIWNIEMRSLCKLDTSVVHKTSLWLCCGWDSFRYLSVQA